MKCKGTEGSAAAALLSSLRKNRRGGRKPVMHRCPYCKQNFSATDVRAHKPICRRQHQA